MVNVRVQNVFDGGEQSRYVCQTCRCVSKKTYHLLDCADASQGPKISVRDLWEPILDTVQTLSCNGKTCVGTMASLRLESHGRRVGSAVLCGLVIGPRRVPGQTQEDGTVTAIVIVVVLQELGNSVVNLLVVERLRSLAGSGTRTLGRCKLGKSSAYEAMTRKE